MAMRKTKVERIIDTVLSAAGLSEAETASLLEEHWSACSKRAVTHGSPHRPEWKSTQNSLRDAFTKGAAGIDPEDGRTRQQFGRLVEVCKAPPNYSDWD